jgi:hypothetical protein
MRAAQAAEAGNKPHPPVSAAIGGASVAVLSAFFPLDIAELEAALDAQEAATWPGDKHENFAAGERSAAPSGAGQQLREVGPAGADGSRPSTDRARVLDPERSARAQANLARPFYLSSTNEFRPPPPPAFRSPKYNADTARSARSRTRGRRNKWPLRCSGT